MAFPKLTRRRAFALVGNSSILAALSSESKDKTGSTPAKTVRGKPRTATPTGVVYSEPYVRPLSTTGQFQAGCTWSFYLTGTTTVADGYEDGELTTPYSQPIAADSAGRFSPIYLDP